jgi:hypothetical protein
MCLSGLLPKNEVLKKCRKSTVLKGALVGYKVVSVVTTDPEEYSIESPYYGSLIRTGWNKDKKTKGVIHNYTSLESFSYPTGLHVYTSLSQAREEEGIDPLNPIIPVHFYPKDVLVEGHQGYVAKRVHKFDYRGVPIAVVVVTKYFLSKEKYASSIRTAQKHPELHKKRR